MPTDERLFNLLDRLLARTIEGRQLWERSGDRQAFEASVGSWTVVIESVDDDGSAPFRLAILDADAQSIESLQTIRVAAPRSGNVMTTEVRNRREEIQSRNRSLRDLFEAARRQVTGVDSALDEINRILDEP